MFKPIRAMGMTWSWHVERLHYAPHAGVHRQSFDWSCAHHVSTTSHRCHNHLLWRRKSQILLSASWIRLETQQNGLGQVAKRSHISHGVVALWRISTSFESTHGHKNQWWWKIILFSRIFGHSKVISQTSENLSSFGLDDELTVNLCQRTKE